MTQVNFPYVEEITSLEDLKDLIPSGSRRIGIDGINGSRKTSTANYLSDQTGIECLHIDDFLIKNQGGFLDYVRYQDLENVLAARETYIIEGICLLQVLEKIQTEIDLLIYLKRYHLGLWADERELCVDPEDAESFLQKERQYAAMITGEADDTGASMSDDIVRYHSKYRPQSRAQLIYRWDDQ